jgi:hypothetical protein
MSHIDGRRARNALATNVKVIREPALLLQAQLAQVVPSEIPKVQDPAWFQHLYVHSCASEVTLKM